MTINLAGTAIKDVRVAGTQAQKVMLGTGTGAIEVWSAVPPYAESGAISAQAGGAQGYWKTVASHTTTRAVQSATISATVVWTNVGSSTHKVAITVDGVQVVENATKPSSGANRSQSASATTALAAGAVINFRITSGDANSTNRSLANGGSWSVNG